jgi:SPOR domain
MAVQVTHHSGARGPRHVSAFRRKRVRVWIVAGICALFAGFAWAWAFQRAPGITTAGGVPLLVADSHPTRERPTDPGGLTVPNIDPLAYDSGRDPPKIENILPPPAEPLPPPAPTVARQAATPTPPAARQAAAAPTATPYPLSTAAASTPSPSVEVAAVVAPPPRKPRPPRAVATREVGIKSPTTRQPKAAAARPAPKPAPARRINPAPVVAASGTGGYLQLAAVRSPSDAMRIGKRLRQRYGDVLRAFAFNYVPVDLGSRGVFYRIVAGPMAPNRAAAICDSLRRRGADCIVTER